MSNKNYKVTTKLPQLPDLDGGIPVEGHEPAVFKAAQEGIGETASYGHEVPGPGRDQDGIEWDGQHVDERQNRRVRTPKKVDQDGEEQDVRDRDQDVQSSKKDAPVQQSHISRVEGHKEQQPHGYLLLREIQVAEHPEELQEQGSAQHQDKDVDLQVDLDFEQSRPVGKLRRLQGLLQIPHDFITLLHASHP